MTELSYIATFECGFISKISDSCQISRIEGSEGRVTLQPTEGGLEDSGGGLLRSSYD